MTATIRDAAAVQALFDAHFAEGTASFEVLTTGPLCARLKMRYAPTQLRPGGTVSGPTMMALADAAMYAAILANAGPELLAVTTDFSIHFLRKPQPGDLEAEARIVKLGKVLVVCTVDIFSGEIHVAHCSGTYSRPPPHIQAAAEEQAALPAA
ncbi:MAG: PaaI family thioesterase [Oceanococcaceae bacterium]